MKLGILGIHIGSYYKVYSPFIFLEKNEPKKSRW